MYYFLIGLCCAVGLFLLRTLYKTEDGFDIKQINTKLNNTTNLLNKLNEKIKKARQRNDDVKANIDKIVKEHKKAKEKEVIELQRIKNDSEYKDEILKNAGFEVKEVKPK